MSRFKYPVDTDQFQEIREQGKLYVDKTDMVYNLVNEYKYVFLARPRRFGKSLLCNTFKAYFKGQKELFDACPESEFMVSSSNQRGLKIMELEKEWKTYPVLHFDMSIMRNCSNMDGYREALSDVLARYEKQYGTTKEAEEFGTRFHQLLRHIHDTQRQKVVVIIDEYDTPMMRNLYNEDVLKELRTMLRGFYQTVKLDGEYLRFVFITGVTKFSQLSIFSELNNLNQISMLDDYSGICGITQEELDTVLRPCVEEYAENLEITVDEAYALLKKNYDGYHFSPKSKDVYAPFSLLRALDGKNTYHYWFESGTSSSLLEHLRHFPITRALDYDGVAVSENEFSIPCEDAETPMPLLYQSGYLTIASYDRLLQRYELKIPNNEVRKGLIDCLMPIILKRPVADNNSVVTAIAKAIFDGNLSDALTALRSYIAKIPYDIITKEEWEDKEKRESFYKLLIYMVFSLLNSIVDTEVKSILGRADVVIKTDTDIFVLELKVDDSVENALAQIDSKGYAIPYETDGRKVTKCGVCISSEQRNITHWRSVDVEGKVIDEQKF
ncbi:MAG: ATP-binding protein [Bacteroidaceae bacterium]|nr:ATP-binding protein [Bacteroidaceae bacterium]